MLKGQEKLTKTQPLPPCLNALSLQELQQKVDNISASDSLIKYILALVKTSRELDEAIGLSPRASKAILKAAKSWAMVQGRQYVVPEDVQTIFPLVAEHRMSRSTNQNTPVISNIILSRVNPIL